MERIKHGKEKKQPLDRTKAKPKNPTKTAVKHAAGETGSKVEAKVNNDSKTAKKEKMKENKEKKKRERKEKVQQSF